MSSRKKLKNDQYKKARGGRSKRLLLSCEKCKTRLFTYQKDGPGILKRLYLDRIESEKPVKENANLLCQSCHILLGVPIFYEKENRLAIRLFARAVAKKIVKEINKKAPLY